MPTARLPLWPTARHTKPFNSSFDKLLCLEANFGGILSYLISSGSALCVMCFSQVAVELGELLGKAETG